MAKLWFQNSQGQERVIMEVNNFNDVFTGIWNFLEEHNYKSYYIRSWEEGGRIKYDVGSWTEFFYTDLKGEESYNE